MQILEGKPKIDYPTTWEYRVIGEDRKKMTKAIAGVIKKDFDLKNGNSSKGGRFTSVVVSVEVSSEQERDQIFVSLREHNAIKMVL